MAITEGVHPAELDWTGVWGSGNGKTTASFTPDSGGLLLALVCGGNPGAGTVTISDSVSGTTGWVLLRRENTFNTNCQGTAEVWCKDSPGVSMTVTATSSAATGSGGQLTVLTLLGALAAASQNGAVNSMSTDATTTPIQVSVAAGTGNRVYAAALNWDTSAAMSVLANTAAVAAYADGTNGNNWAACKSSADTAGTATYGYSTTVRGKIAAAEIKAAEGGTNATVPMSGSLAAAGSIPAVQVMNLSGPNYATTASDLGGGAGSWADTGNAGGAPDSTYATWAVT